MKRILVVEDNEVNRELIVQLLEDDYEILEAENGALGIEAALEHRPDVILMDLSMPVMDGWEAMRTIRANAEIADIPIVVLTAHAMSGDGDDAIAAGADDFLTKPVDEDALLAVVRHYVTGR